MSYIIRQAEKVDLEKVLSFIKKASLETEGVESFLLMEEKLNGELKGIVGIESIENNGLLRSMVLSQASAEEILLLLRQVIKFAKDKELIRLYCMVSNKNAIELFQLLGFEVVKEREVPEALMESNGVKKLIPVHNLEFLCLTLEKVDK